MLDAVASMPIGRWTGELLGLPSGLLGNPQHHAPILGNGYVGVALSSQRRGLFPANGSSVDLWINSNANWDCEASGAPKPPARCTARVLGGLSISTPALASETSFETEQRIENGTLWTRRTAYDGSVVLETETFVDPEKNLVVTEVTMSRSGPESPAAPNEQLEMIMISTLFTYGHNRHVRTSTVSACTLEERGVPACSRRFHPPNTTGFRAPWTALALHAEGATPAHVALANVSITDTGPFGNISYAASTFMLGGRGSAARRTLRLIVSLADNILAADDETANGSYGTHAPTLPRAHH